MKYSFSRFLLAPLMALIVAGLAAPVEAAREGGGGGGGRGGGGAQAVVAVAPVPVALKPAVAAAPGITRR